jgi:error-prone DNA polymerase
MASMADARPSPSRKSGYMSPGARKEKLRERSYARPRRAAPVRYAELHVASAFSFLDGASQPEDLVERAAALGLEAVALADRSGVYGAPRFHKAAKEAGLRGLHCLTGGAEGPLARRLRRDGPEAGRRRLL